MAVPRVAISSLNVQLQQVGQIANSGLKIRYRENSIMGRGRTKKTVTLEDYEHFLENPYDEAFSLGQLNEVILIHGFSKIHKRPKRELYDALSTIDLIKPQLSTLKDEFSLYDSSLSLDQVKKDLESLNWQECAVPSIETIGHSGPTGDWSVDFLP